MIVPIAMTMQPTKQLFASASGQCGTQVGGREERVTHGAWSDGDRAARHKGTRTEHRRGIRPHRWQRRCPARSMARAVASMSGCSRDDEGDETHSSVDIVEARRSELRELAVEPEWTRRVSFASAPRSPKGERDQQASLSRGDDARHHTLVVTEEKESDLIPIGFGSA